MTRRGQAALEFLMTYGWAILAAVVVVGVLWYMIGNPANLAGNDFQVSVPFVAEAMAVDETGSVQLEIRNGGGNTVTIGAVNITLDAPDSCTADTGGDVAPGSTDTYTINCITFTSGERLSGDVKITYVESGSTLTQTATGTIRAVIP